LTFDVFPRARARRQRNCILRDDAGAAVAATMTTMTTSRAARASDLRRSNRIKETHEEESRGSGSALRRRLNESDVPRDENARENADAI
jgi:hypothetical protein